MSDDPSTDKFQTRDELVPFIEQQTAHGRREGGRTAAAGRPAGAVGHEPARSASDSAGYCVLKAAAFALGYVGPEQAKEEIHTHHQLRDLYAGYGFLPHHGQQSFLVPLASAHLPAFEPQGRRLRDELRQKMTAQAGQVRPGRSRLDRPPSWAAHEGARHDRPTPPAARSCRCRCSAN